MPQLGFSGLSKAGLSGAMNGLDPIGLANSPFFRNFAAGANIAHPVSTSVEPARTSPWSSTG